jgi:hypothetical protein
MTTPTIAPSAPRTAEVSRNTAETKAEILLVRSHRNMLHMPSQQRFEHKLVPQ